MLESTKTNPDNAGKSALTEIYDIMNVETLHWKWSKLSIPQQKNRITEYLKVTVSDTTKRSEAEKLIFGLIDSNGLKKNSVTYDMNKSEVTGIFIKEYQDIIQEDDNSDDSDTNDDLE